MREQTIANGFRQHDQMINSLLAKIGKLSKGYDTLYLNFLTQQMMWDCLMACLSKRGVITQDEFNAELEALKAATQKAMEADAEKKKMESEGKVTVTSDVPAIPVILKPA